LFNAVKDTRTPAWVGVGSIALNAGGDWLLMQFWGHWGIALVTSIVSYVNTLTLYGIFRHRHGPLNEPFLLRRLGTHLLLSVVFGVVLFVLSRSLTTAPETIVTPLHLLHFAGVLAAGVGVYLGLAYVFKVEEVMALSR